MRTLTVFALFVCVFVTACDVQSGMTKKSLEEYNTTPTPGRTFTPEPPIDPADSITVDTALTGDQLAVNKPEEKKPLTCTKYNKVVINGNAREVTVKGACKSIMINGDENKVTGEAFTEIILNGTGNTVTHTKYVNAIRPIITENASPNTVEKVQAAAETK